MSKSIPDQQVSIPSIPIDIDAILQATGVASSTYKADTHTGAGPAGEGGPILISYCTDVEGNYDYWQRWLNLSKVVVRLDDDGKPMKIPYSWTGRTPHSAMSIVSNSTMNSINIAKAYGGKYPDPVYPQHARLKLMPNCHLVFGGDVCDRGPGDIRLLWDLIQLQEDHPGRVHFILGNRDVNKLRLPTELHDSYTRSPGATYWLPNDPEQRPQGNIDRLKWILARTMGAPENFEHRRTELKQIILQQKRDRAAQRIAKGIVSRGPLAATPAESDLDDAFWSVDNRYATDRIVVTDEDVLESYFDLLLPPAACPKRPSGPRHRKQLTAHGLLLSYLANGNLLLRIEDNLFVHGGLNAYNLGWIPPLSPYRPHTDDISATGAMVRQGGGAQRGDSIPILEMAPSSSVSSSSITENHDFINMQRITRRAAFDAWSSEVNWRSRQEVRDFSVHTRDFLQSLNARHPNSPNNNRNTFGRNSYDANYTACAADSGVPAHWARTGTYTHPQPGSRLLMQGMAVCPDRSRNPSIIYAGYVFNSMPVNIDRYEGTLTDERGRVIADAMRGQDLASMLHVTTGSMLVKRRTQRSLSPISAIERMGIDAKADNETQEDEDATSVSTETTTASANTASIKAAGPSSEKREESGLNNNIPPQMDLYMTPEFARVVVEDLKINRIYCGHQPHGDAPLTINVTIDRNNNDKKDINLDNAASQSKDRLQIILADTSYSANIQWNLDPVLRPKTQTGDLVLWTDDWKPMSLDRLKAENEEREKLDGDIDDDNNSGVVSSASSKPGDATGSKAGPVGQALADAKAAPKDVRESNKAGFGDKGQAKAEMKADSKGGASPSAKPEALAAPKSGADGVQAHYAPTPQMQQDAQDNATYNMRPLQLWNLDTIHPTLNTRGVAVSEVLVYVPLFTGVRFNESVAEAERRREQYSASRFEMPNAARDKSDSRVFMHGILSDGSPYAFELPSNKAASSDTGNSDAPPVDRYLGKSTRSGAWVVKAVNVAATHNLSMKHTRHLPANAGDNKGKGQARAQAPGVSTLEEKVYLLSRGEPNFVFKNKLVAASDMEEEMNA